MSEQSGEIFDRPDIDPADLIAYGDAMRRISRTEQAPLMADIASGYWAASHDSQNPELTDWLDEYIPRTSEEFSEFADRIFAAGVGLNTGTYRQILEGRNPTKEAVRHLDLGLKAFDTIVRMDTFDTSKPLISVFGDFQTAGALIRTGYVLGHQRRDITQVRKTLIRSYTDFLRMLPSPIRLQIPEIADTDEETSEQFLPRVFKAIAETGEDQRLSIALAMVLRQMTGYDEFLNLMRNPATRNNMAHDLATLSRLVPLLGEQLRDQGGDVTPTDAPATPEHHDYGIQTPETIELDFEFFPREAWGSKLEELITNIQNRYPNRTDIRIDHRRMEILQRVADYWGNDYTTLAFGKFDTRKRVLQDGIEYPDEYLVLLLQDPSQGIEHALAINPVAGEHAVFVHRGDTSEHSWQDMMRHRKRAAREYGGRRIIHQAKYQDVYEAVYNRIVYLLACEPDEYERISFAGFSVEMRNRGIGTTALTPYEQP